MKIISSVLNKWFEVNFLKSLSLLIALSSTSISIFMYDYHSIMLNWIDLLNKIKFLVILCD